MDNKSSSRHELCRQFSLFITRKQRSTVETSAVLKRPSPNVAIVESRPINVESCINCLFISLELYTGGPSGIRQTYPSFLPYGPQRASTLYLIPSTPTFPHPVRTAHGGYTAPDEFPSTVKLRGHTYMHMNVFELI
uniref:Uncharacterized protein n=1 Tax=Magallana gigas TaxID=29159 RepID=K1P1F9_MAGGI